MYRRVLVPLDESILAEEAVPVGARLAMASAGTLILVDVVQGLAEFEAGLVSASTWAPAAVEAERASAQHYLTQIRRREARDGLDIELATYAGAVAPTLLLAVREYHADAIVMTTHGRTGLARWALGSVADKLVRQAPVPVLLLHVGGPEIVLGPAESTPLRALVPLDGSLLAESALLPAVHAVAALAGSHAGDERAALHLVRVLDAFDVMQWTRSHGLEVPSWQQAVSQSVEASTTYLRGVAGRLQAGEAGALGVPITWSVIFDREGRSLELDVADAILRTATAGEPVAGTTAPGRCQLIALATHGRGGIARWALGSIAERVLQASTLPVLLVGPKARAVQHADGRALPTAATPARG